MSYTEFTTLPDNVVSIDTGADSFTEEKRKLLRAEGYLVWSSLQPVPPIGSELYVHITFWEPALGEHRPFKWGRVKGYFQEHGFFGLLMTFNDPPPTWKARGYPHAHIFGIDIDFDRNTS